MYEFIDEMRDAIAGEPQWVSAGRIGDYVFFEGAGIGLEADLWPVGEAIVRRQFREIMRAPLKLARDRAVVMEIEIDEQPKREKVRAFTMTISNTPMIVRPSIRSMTSIRSC